MNFKLSRYSNKFVVTVQLFSINKSEMKRKIHDDNDDDDDNWFSVCFKIL